MHRHIRLFVGVFALVGFFLSLAVHLAAVAGIDASSHLQGVWFLHAGIFVVFLPLLLYLRRDFGTNPSFDQLTGALPGWAAATCFIIFVYAILNFVIFLVGSEGGSPGMRDGRYVLLDHGRVIRDLSLIEYSTFKANVTRAFSGHWLVFYFVPATYFLLGRKSKL